MRARKKNSNPVSWSSMHKEKSLLYFFLRFLWFWLTVNKLRSKRTLLFKVLFNTNRKNVFKREILRATDEQ